MMVTGILPGIAAAVTAASLRLAHCDCREPHFTLAAVRATHGCTGCGVSVLHFSSQDSLLFSACSLQPLIHQVDDDAFMLGWLSPERKSVSSVSMAVFCTLSSETGHPSLKGTSYEEALAKSCCIRDRWPKPRVLEPEEQYEDDDSEGLEPLSDEGRAEQPEMIVCTSKKVCACSSPSLLLA